MISLPETGMRAFRWETEDWAQRCMGNEKRDTGAERGHTLVRLSGENAEGTSGRIPDQGPGADRETGVSESAGLSAGLLQDF